MRDIPGPKRILGSSQSRGRVFQCWLLSAVPQAGCWQALCHGVDKSARTPVRSARAQHPGLAPWLQLGRPPSPPSEPCPACTQQVPHESPRARLSPAPRLSPRAVPGTPSPSPQVVPGPLSPSLLTASCPRAFPASCPLPGAVTEVPSARAVPAAPGPPCLGTSRWWCRPAERRPLCLSRSRSARPGRPRSMVRPEGARRERKRRRAGERWRHRLQRGRERRGILRGVAAAGPLLRGRPVWIRVLCCGEGGALAGGGCGTLPKGRCARLRRVRRKVTPYSSGGGTLYLREQSVSVCLGGTLPLDPST